MDKLIAIALSIQAIHASVQPGMLLAPVKDAVARSIRWVAGRIHNQNRLSHKTNNWGDLTWKEWEAEQAEQELKAERLACWIEKPLYECTTCMGGIWTLILYAIFYGLDPGVFIVMLEVIGLNALIANITQHEN